jgi:hypothetical protein
MARTRLTKEITMRCVKSLGLAFVTVVALMAFAGTAAATTVTSPEGTTPDIVAESSNSKFHGSFVTLECTSSKLEGNVESHGAGAVEWAVDAFSLEGCNYQMTIVAKGSLAIHATATTGDGTVTWSGASITMHTSVGACTLTANGTDIGVLDGGAPARLLINSTIPRTAGNFLCGSSVTWTASFKVSSPSSLEVH